MVRLMVNVVFYLAALVAGRHIHTHAERGLSMFWSKETLHSLCQDVKVEEEQLQNGNKKQYMRAKCRDNRGNTSRPQTLSSGAVVDSRLDLDQCLAWNRQTHNFKSVQGGNGIQQGGCYGCRYYDYRQLLIPNMHNFQCMCRNAPGGSSIETPDSEFVTAGSVSFDMDGVIGAVSGVLKCHGRQGEVIPQQYS